MRAGWLTTFGLTALAGALAAQDHEHQGHDMQAMAADTSGGRTPLYDNLGSYHMAVTTRSPVAQRYFDQGLRLTYGFNHDEAIKSYREGIREDSTCAMCWWGIAYALGPNINVPMDTAAVRPAWQALQQAVRLAPEVSPREQAYIKALQTRYSSDPPANRAPLDSAWAAAIGEVSRRYPRDDDAATLHAEALMDLRPWNYWTNAGKPRAPSTMETVTILERVVKRTLDHPGACHFYIHAVEASNFAARAVPCAERLGKPGARRRPPGPHADAHLHAARPVGGRGGAQCGCGARGPGVPGCAAPDRRLSDGLRPPQLPCDVGGAQHARPERRGARAPRARSPGRSRPTWCA